MEHQDHRESENQIGRIQANQVMSIPYGRMPCFFSYQEERPTDDDMPLLVVAVDWKMFVSTLPHILHCTFSGLREAREVSPHIGHQNWPELRRVQVEAEATPAVRKSQPSLGSCRTYRVRVCQESVGVEDHPGLGLDSDFDILYLGFGLVVVVEDRF